jgi:hypothetical protein
LPAFYSFLHPLHLQGLLPAFLSIPQSQIFYGSWERESFLQDGVVDEKHGYIKYRATDNSENFEFVVFKKTDGRLLAAISWGPGDCIEDAPETCESDLRFFAQTENGWKPLGTSPLPRAFNKKLVYELPRQGRSIQVRTREGSSVATYEFNGTLFQVKHPKKFNNGKP